VSDEDDSIARAVKLWREQHPEQWAELERRLSPKARRERRAALEKAALQRATEALEHWNGLRPEEQRLKSEQWLYDALGGGRVLGAPGARLPRPGETVQKPVTPGTQELPPFEKMPKDVRAKIIRVDVAAAADRRKAEGQRAPSLGAECRFLDKEWRPDPPLPCRSPSGATLRRH
jgi:hypothetical protein